MKSIFKVAAITLTLTACGGEHAAPIEERKIPTTNNTSGSDYRTDGDSIVYITFPQSDAPNPQ